MTGNCEFNIDKVIQKLLTSPRNPYLTEQAIRQVCFRSRELFYQQPMLLQLQAPIKICGDIHGQFPDLLNIFNTQGHPDSTKYLFIGDYVDRGKQSLQTITLLLAYKIKYPEQIYLLRGNHECCQINRLYGFYDQCKRKYSTKIWRLFTDVFNSMPVSAIIDQKIFCVHGGLSPQLRNLKQINRIQRPIQVPDEGLLCDLLWSDPDKYIQGWQKSPRGVSYVFGEKVIDNFLKKYDLDLICRAHQVVQEGYQFFHNKKLVTIFSASNYCGQFDNSGAVMNVDENLKCSFKIFEPSKKTNK